MKQFLNQLLTFAMFILSIALFYMAVTMTFSSSFINILIFFSALFVLIQACGLIDKAHHFGKYNDGKEDDKE